MALLKATEMRAMRPDDLRAKFKEINDELMHEKGVAAMGGAPASPGRIRALRTEVARIHTVIREAQLEEAMKAAGRPARETKKKEKKTKLKELAAEKPKQEEKK